MRIEVEEIAVGKVMRLLLKTPGVVNVDLEEEETKGKPNGEARSYKPRGTFEKTGQQVVEEMLIVGPRTREQLATAFARNGRSPHSINSCLHTMRQGGDVTLSPDGVYSL